MTGPVQLDVVAHDTLAERQRRLVQALFAPAAPGPQMHAAELGLGELLRCQGTAARTRLGVQAYRSNGRALADRALAAAYPTLAALMGGEAFAALAADCWQRHPPSAGDIGEYGAALPDLVAAADSLRDWPYLADCARLDWAVHQAARAADASFDVESLSLLLRQAPADITVEWMPGHALLASRWPVVAIWHAHREAEAGLIDTAQFEARMQALRRADDAADWVWVQRSGLAVKVSTLDADTWHWMQALAAGATLEQAFAALDDAGRTLDFDAWLRRAVAEGWLRAFRLLPGVVAS